MKMCYLRPSFITLILLALTKLNLCYDIGYVYKYKYESNIEMLSSKALKNSSEPRILNSVQAQFIIQPLEYKNKNLLLNRLKIVNIETPSANQQPLFSNPTKEHLEKYEVHFEVDISTQTITSMFFDKEETFGSKRFKLGILDLFNGNISAEKQISLMGNCKVNNTILNETVDTLYLEKVKYECDKQNKFNDEFRKNEEVFNSQFERTIKLNYKFLKNEKSGSKFSMIENVSAEDHSKIFFQMFPLYFHIIKTKQSVVLTEKNLETDKILDKAQGNSDFSLDTEKFDIEKLFLVNEAQEKLEHLLEDLKTKGNKLDTEMINSAYLSLIKLIRNGYKNDWKKLLNYYQIILKQNSLSKKIKKILITATLNSQTKNVLKVLKSLLDAEKWNKKTSFDKSTIALIDEVIVASPLLTRSTTEFMDIIFAINKNHKEIPIKNLKERAILSVGSTLSQISKEDSEPIAQLIDPLYEPSYVDYLTFYPVYIEALKNSNHPKCIEFMEHIWNFTSSSKLTLSALQYLNKNFKSGQIRSSVLDKLLVTFYQLDSAKKYSEEVKIEALSMILDQFMESVLPMDSPILENIFISLSETESSQEYLVFCRQIILNKMNENSSFKDLVFNLMSRSVPGTDFLHLYNSTGHSNALAGDLYSNSSFNNPFIGWITGSKCNYGLIYPWCVKEFSGSSLSYKLKQFMSDEGFLRMLDFSLGLQDQNNNSLDFLKFEIYGKNLKSLVNESPANDIDKDYEDEYDQGSEATVSIHLSVMNQKLKIVELFKGYSSMLTTVWNLPTQMTSIFDINFMTNDQTEYILLQNGMVVRLENIGTISVDLSGLTEISLWSQYFQLSVRKSVSVRLDQELSLISDQTNFAQLHSSLDTTIITDVWYNNDFSVNPSKLCTKISNRKILLNEHSRVTTFQNETVLSMNESSKQSVIQPSTFVLSKEATANC